LAAGAAEAGLSKLERLTEHLLPRLALLLREHREQLLVQLFFSSFPLLAHLFEVALALTSAEATLASALSAALAQASTLTAALTLTAAKATAATSSALTAAKAAATGTSRSAGATRTAKLGSVLTHDLAHLLPLVFAQAKLVADLRVEQNLRCLLLQSELLEAGVLTLVQDLLDFLFESLTLFRGHSEAATRSARSTRTAGATLAAAKATLALTTALAAALTLTSAKATLLAATLTLATAKTATLAAALTLAATEAALTTSTGTTGATLTSGATRATRTTLAEQLLNLLDLSLRHLELGLDVALHQNAERHRSAHSHHRAALSLSGTLSRSTLSRSALSATKSTLSGAALCEHARH